MMRTGLLVSRMVALTICSMMVLSAPLVAADEESVTVRGEIEAAQYDDDGNVVSVAVFDTEWGWVLVANKGKGKELLNHVGAEASITGQMVEMEEDIDYSYEITVTGYTIEEPTEPDDDRDLEPEG